MALFSRKKEAVKDAAPAAVAPKALPTDRDLAGVIIRPYITEKAVGQSEQRVYTFLVRKDATKYDVRDAVQAVFDVTPVKVNIVNKAPRKHMSRTRGRVVSHKGYKKAYVYLKEGDSISLI